MKGLICIQCGQPLLKTKSEFIALRPNGEEMWLCGRDSCERDYNDDRPPKLKRAVK